VTGYPLGKNVMTGLQENTIENVVDDALKKLFTEISIEKVFVHEKDDVDEERERIRIDVLFDGEPKDYDVFNIVVRTVRPRLEELNEFSIPVVSFIHVSEASDAGLEAP